MITCKKDYTTLLCKLCKEGIEVGNTYELAGEKVTFMLSETKAIKEMFEITDEFAHDFIEAISMFKDKTMGPYITEKYFSLIPALKSAADQFKRDSSNTRRAVITFPKEHCFQSIQFLLRDNTINIVCYMRSCDSVKNLPYDAWLCYTLADMLNYYLTDILGARPYKYHKLTMMFGSLHIYKEDVAHVF